MLLIDLAVGQVLVYAMNKSEKVGINTNQRQQRRMSNRVEEPG